MRLGFGWLMGVAAIGCADPGRSQATTDASSDLGDLADTALPPTDTVSDTREDDLDSDTARDSGPSPDDVRDTFASDTIAGDTIASDTTSSDTTPGDTTAGDTGAPLDLSCLGESVPLVLAGDLPYVEVRIGAAKGYFLVDFASTYSTIDPRGFTGGTPQPVAGTSDRYAGFSFFGDWGTVRLASADYACFGGAVRQAGILGTDFLSLDVYSVYWARSGARAATAVRDALGPEPLLIRGTAAFCDDPELAGAGLAAASTEGWYSNELADVGSRPNVPILPTALLGEVVPAQVDTGYGDSLVRHAVNANRAAFDRLPRALERVPARDLTLTTCVPGVNETVLAHRLPADAPLAFTASLTSAAGLVSFADAIIYLKDTPAAARSCGGIGTWSTPAAQLGVSFTADLGLVVFDPLSARLWVPAPR